MKRLLFLLIFTPSLLFSQTEMLGFKFGSSYEIVYHQLEDSFKNYASGSHVGKDGKKLTASLNAYGFVFAFNW